MTSGAYTTRNYLALVAVATLAASLAACGGSSSAGTPAPTGRPTTTTAAARAATSTTRPAPTTTTTMPPYSFDGSVPPPEIVDTGDDYVAILASYDRYLDWLTGHNPDPKLLANVFVDGTDVKKRWESDLRILAEKNLRMFDVNPSFAGTVTKEEQDMVHLLLREEPTEIRLVDPTGKVVDNSFLANEIRAAVTLVTSDGRWAIGAIVPLMDDPTVKL